MARILIGLSGGVDSAVAAARLLADGHQVEAMFMQLAGDLDQMTAGYTGEASGDAQLVADFLGIKLRVWDLSQEFQSIVKTHFTQAYRDGMTPNPCVRCNRRIKFGLVVERALAQGFDYVATGHYARSIHSTDLYMPASDLPFAITSTGVGGWQLRRAANLDKDQSYVLAGARAELLQHAVFPLGDVVSKDAVRTEAAALGIPVATKRDSFDICFIPDGDTRGYLRRHLGEAPGDIVDEDGAVVGSHTGAFQYTVGQRRGLHLPRPHADGQPRYVTRLDPGAGRVYVGPLRDLEVAELQCGPVNWLIDPVPHLSAEEIGAEVTVQFRAHGNPLPAQVRGGLYSADRGDELMSVSFRRSLPRGVAPGQSLVVYVGDRVVAQGNIRPPG